MEDIGKCEIEEKIKYLEVVTNDADKYSQALCEIRRNKRKAALCVADDEGNVVGSARKIKKQTISVTPNTNDNTIYR